MLTVYGRATSSNVQALLWGLEELGLEYTRLDYGEVHGGLNSPGFTAMNPHRKIPVLTLDGQAIWETPAILRYLATEHGDDAFWPRNPLDRARIDMWAEWAKHSVAEAFTGPVFWRTARTRPENQDQDLVAASLARFEDALATAEPVITAGGYLCGSAFTLADIQFGHVLYRYFDIDIQRRALPGLRTYFDRLTNRPAYRRTVMVSYDTLRDSF